MKSVKERIEKIKNWDLVGKEHDFHEMNLVRRLNKSIKMEDFHDNYLEVLKGVVDSIEEFNCNSWRIKTKNGRVFLYYSTSGKIKECIPNSKFFKVSYKNIVKFFSKKEFRV